MSDLIPGGAPEIDWNGPITIIITALVSLVVEYVRRQMPPDRNNRRKDDRNYKKEEVYESDDE